MIVYQSFHYLILTKDPITNEDILDSAKSSFCTRYKINRSEVIHSKILSKSLDSRVRHNLAYVVNVGFTFNKNTTAMLLYRYKELKVVNEILFDEVLFKDIPKVNNKKVLVVGMGPCGLFCADTLNKLGHNVTLMDRGEEVIKRQKKVDLFFSTGNLDEETNIQFGMGGAGTFSDGKLFTNHQSLYSKYVLQRFFEYGAPNDILFDSHPHLGTDVLQIILKNIQDDFTKRSIKLCYETKMTYLKPLTKGVEVTYIKDSIEYKEVFDDVFLAIGHSAHDTYRMLSNIMVMEQKAFAVGVRIEHLQKNIDKTQYNNRPCSVPSEYKLVKHLSNSRTVYTFCMCPGGTVVNASSENAHLVCNGMSNHARDSINCNSALLVDVLPSDYDCGNVLDGLFFQEKIEHKAFLQTKSYNLPVVLLKDFLNHTSSTSIGSIQPSCKPGYVLTDFTEILPPFIYDSICEAIPLMNQLLSGFSDEDAVLTGVETRSSAPLRLLRSKNYESSIPHVYPIGEGSGYAGGIITSAVDGIRSALAFLQEEKENESK